MVHSNTQYISWHFRYIMVLCPWLEKVFPIMGFYPTAVSCSYQSYSDSPKSKKLILFLWEQVCKDLLFLSKVSIPECIKKIKLFFCPRYIVSSIYTMYFGHDLSTQLIRELVKCPIVYLSLPHSPYLRSVWEQIVENQHISTICSQTVHRY